MAAGRPTNADIMLALGQLTEGISRLRIDLDQYTSHQRATNETIARKLDDHGKHIREIEFGVQTTAKVAAQAREEVKTVHGRLDSEVEALNDRLDKQIMPIVQNWKGLQRAFFSLVWLFGALGVSAGAALWWAGDMAIAWLRAILRIDG